MSKLVSPLASPLRARAIKRFKQEVKEQIKDPLDDSEIRKYLPNVKILTYDMLSSIPNIEALLPRDKSYIFLLYLETPSSGHWVSLMRYGKTIEYFDSYGGKIDAPLLWLPKTDREPLGTSTPYLTRLLNDAVSRFKVIYNPISYQSKKDDVNSCGRHSIFRVKNLLENGMDLKAYNNYIQGIRDREGLSYDEIVSIFIQTPQ